MAIEDKSKAFKAYDVRGSIGERLDARMVHEIGQALVAEFGAKTIAIGADNRPSSPELKSALMEGVTGSGAKVIDIGATGTEEVYFAAQSLDVDLGVEITASHNPIGDNGMKFIHRGGKPLTGDELGAVRDRVVKGEFPASPNKGAIETQSILDAYVDHLLSYIDTACLEGIKILTNAGNGMAGHVIDAIEARLGAKSPFIKMHHAPDASFPNGIPNPLLPENRPPTIAKLQECGADLAIAWDGDFDRCFFFDEKGQFIEGYYIVGLLASAFLEKHRGEAVVHDPRLIWNTQAKASEMGGRAVQSRTGHAFIKAKMREVDAIYGGEMSAHHYFREFGYCDSGMIPWLLIVERIVRSGKPLSVHVDEAQKAFPCSGEINYKVKSSAEIIAKIREHFAPLAPKIDEMDGIGLDFGDWRLNLRASNTEPLLRLNIESRGDAVLVEQKRREIEKLINM